MARRVLTMDDICRRPTMRAAALLDIAAGWDCDEGKVLTHRKAGELRWPLALSIPWAAWSCTFRRPTC